MITNKSILYHCLRVIPNKHFIQQHNVQCMFRLTFTNKILSYRRETALQGAL